MRILVAEDDPLHARRLAQMLENWGYEVLQAADGAEAWQFLQRHPVEMVIADWIMPRAGGLELCREIRSLPEGQNIYIILLTSRSDQESLAEGLAAGADDFASKPIQREELRARIRAGHRILDLQGELNARIGRIGQEQAG